MDKAASDMFDPRRAAFPVQYATQHGTDEMCSFVPLCLVNDSPSRSFYPCTAFAQKYYLNGNTLYPEFDF